MDLIKEKSPVLDSGRDISCPNVDQRCLCSELSDAENCMGNHYVDESCVRPVPNPPRQQDVSVVCLICSRCRLLDGPRDKQDLGWPLILAARPYPVAGR